MLIIRKFEVSDAEAVSDLIRLTMTCSNIQDYPLEGLQPLIDYFSPRKIMELNLNRYCLVAVQNSMIIGTAAIEEKRVSTFFVHPKYQGLGVGTRLLAKIETEARNLSLKVLQVEASITGTPFYEHNGYHRTGKVIEGVAGPQVGLEKLLDQVPSH